MSGFYELKTSTSGQPVFNLKAENNQVILTSQMYSSEQARENGIASVMKNSSSEKIVEAEG
jgi:uncharacterized protein YegP (UPF0339 family)